MVNFLKLPVLQMNARSVTREENGITLRLRFPILVIKEAEK